MTTYRGGSNGFGGLSPAEQQLFDVGLAQDEQAGVGRPSTYERLRAELLRPTPSPAPAPAPRRTPLPLPRSTPRDRFPAPSPLPGRARKATPGWLREAATPLPLRPAPDRISKIPGRLLESLEEERQLKKRNDSLRRAFKVVPGGDEALATIEALVETDRGGRRIADMPSVKRTLDRALEVDDDRQRKARIRAEAEKIPMGLEAFESFTRERDVEARNEVLRRALDNAAPRTVAQTSLLSDEAEKRLWDDTLALEETKGGDRPSAYNALVQDARIWNDGLSQDEQASPRGRVSEYDRLKNVDRIWEDQLGPDRRAANPPETRLDLLQQLEQMFEVAGLPFDPSAGTWRGFVGDGVNGLTPKDRFFTIGWYAGYSDEQLGRLLGGAAVAEVGPPAGRWDNEVALSPADRSGALTFLQMREPEASEPSALVPRFATGVVRAFADEFDRRSEREVEQSQYWVEQGERFIDFTVDQITQAARDAGDAGQRFLSELEELRDVPIHDKFERINQAILGGMTPQIELTPEGIVRFATTDRFDWNRAIEGLAGNQTYSGSEHPLLSRLPERYREPIGDLFEDAVTVGSLIPLVVGTAAAAPVGATAVLLTVGLWAFAEITNDLSEEDSELIALFEAARRDAQQLLDDLGLDDVSLREIEMRAAEVFSTRR